MADVVRLVPTDAMSPLECAFVAASERRARRVRWTMRSLAALAAAGTIVAFAVHLATGARLADERAQAARELAEAKVTESELEQGRAAVLHDEPEAFAHLSEAYKRDRSPATAFMLARAMQPRLNEVARLPATYGRMWWATFSPDGSRIATADDRAAQVWDAKTYRLLFTLPHGCEVYQAVYSPDGAWLVTVAQAKVRIWDARSGALIRELGPKHEPGSPTSTARQSRRSPFHRGGRCRWCLDERLGDRGAARSWPSAQRAAGFPHLAFGADGWLATTGGQEARVFDSHGWRQILFIPGPVRSIAVDGRRRLAVGSATGEVALWDVRNASRLRALRTSGELVDAVAFSPDGALVAAGSRDGALQVWRADSGALRSQLNPRHGRILWVEFGIRPPRRSSPRTLTARSSSQTSPKGSPSRRSTVPGVPSALRGSTGAPPRRRLVGRDRAGMGVGLAVSPLRGATGWRRMQHRRGFAARRTFHRRQLPGPPDSGMGHRA